MYYEPDDASDLARCILELYNNPARRAEIANSGAAMYEKYRWSVMKREYLGVIDQMINNRRSDKRTIIPTAMEG